MFCSAAWVCSQTRMTKQALECVVRPIACSALCQQAPATVLVLPVRRRHRTVSSHLTDNISNFTTRPPRFCISRRASEHIGARRPYAISISYRNSNGLYSADRRRPHMHARMVRDACLWCLHARWRHCFDSRHHGKYISHAWQ